MKLVDIMTKQVHTIGPDQAFKKCAKILKARHISTAADKSEVIDRFKAGDLFAFEDIVRTYQDRIYNLCRRMLENTHDAEDAAQDVFLKASQALPRFEPGASLYTWLYRIVVNTCIDYKRKPVLESLFGTEEEDKPARDFASNAPSPERSCESRETDYVLRESLGKLSPKLRTAIVLNAIEEMSYEEIAEVLDISLGTVKSRISRARQELIKLMNPKTTADPCQKWLIPEYCSELLATEDAPNG